MQEIRIETFSRPSLVYCGDDALKKAAEYLKDQEVFIVTDTNMFALYGNLLREKFPSAKLFAFSAGEKSKNERTLFRMLDAMLAANLHRSSFVAAVGGGVTGDMAGLAAALYMRGTRLVQIPTTLLAQVDSSVGGKTAIDRGNVKNAIGTFYQPECVFCDPLFLQTLPPREILCGLGEIVKTAILDGDLADMLRQNARRLRDADFLRDITADCVRFKAKIVAADETEKSGIRKCLNLGHTTGHALELRYGRRSHGEYVLIGMWLESFIAEGENACSHMYAESVRDLISLVYPKIPSFANVAECIPYALLDKKNCGKDSVSVVVSSGRGKYEELNLSAEKYAEYLCALQEKKL